MAMGWVVGRVFQAEGTASEKAKRRERSWLRWLSISWGSALCQALRVWRGMVISCPWESHCPLGRMKYEDVRTRKKQQICFQNAMIRSNHGIKEASWAAANRQGLSV